MGIEGIQTHSRPNVTPDTGTGGHLFEPPNNSLEPTRPAAAWAHPGVSLGWPGGSSRGR
jgi:hypothetical protein